MEAKESNWNTTVKDDNAFHEILKTTWYTRESSFLPSLCISCQQEGLEISDLYEQWGDYAYEDNSSPLPANEKNDKLLMSKQ